MPAATSMDCCKAFMTHVARFGVPQSAISDNGNSFIANLYQEIMKTFNIEVKFTPSYHAATNGAIERRHQTIKNALKASLVDMGNHHGDKWMRALPWVLLGKRIAYQPDLDTSSAMLLYGRSPLIPGQVLGQPGPPLNSVQTRHLPEEMYKLESQPAKQTSAKVIHNKISKTEDATHVYVKVDDPKGLSARFEGPFEIVSRPSRSQVTVRLGSYANGTPRLANYNWETCKVAHLRDGFKGVDRPALGRPRARPDPPAVQSQLTSNVNNASGVVEKARENEPGNLPAEIQTSNSEPERPTPPIVDVSQRYPARSSRNTSPRYICAMPPAVRPFAPGA